MTCPNCGAGNPGSARFCMQCGTPLAARCSNCGGDLPAGARFCPNCGQPVAGAEQPDDARWRRLAAATPPRLTEKMRAAPLTSERKQVTALFADVVGSTALAERFDPEDWTALMNGAFDRLFPAIYRYEGTIARLLGDAILAFFGAPVAHEDDPLRAVRAALDLLEAAQGYAEEVRRTYGVEFAVRVGLNTGPVVVGAVGSDLKYEYTALGDAVNIAARLQSAARPMTALISGSTYRFVAPLVECADLGLLEIRGKAEPIQIYEVRGLKAQPGRTRGVSGLTSRLVGRDRELAALLRASQSTVDGRGRVAVVVGEPGLGKSRLIAEWQAAAGPDLRWAVGHALSYGQTLPYHLLIDLVRSLLGVDGEAGAGRTGAALRTVTGPDRSEVVGAEFGLADLPDDEPADEAARDGAYTYLAHLLGLPLEPAARDRLAALDPETLQRQYMAALGDVLGEQAHLRPLALILDDVHWADPSSTDLLVRLLALIQEAPILLCFVTRPDQSAPGWRLIEAARGLPEGERSGVPLTDLYLAPLSAEESQQLVTNLLEVEALPERTRALILKKAEGNPFFVEEVIRMLIERGAIVQRGGGWVAGAEIENVDVPDTLQGLLLARIDRLPEDVKRTLRVAAVIGRQFPVRVLERVLTAQRAG